MSKALDLVVSLVVGFGVLMMYSILPLPLYLALLGVFAVGCFYKGDKGDDDRQNGAK
jgi:hypothetical protein